MKSIHQEINAFLAGNPDANGLVSFCQNMILEHPEEKSLIQEWCLGIFVSKFAGMVFSDKVLTTYSKVYVLDTKELGARIMTRQ